MKLECLLQILQAVRQTVLIKCCHSLVSCLRIIGRQDKSSSVLPTPAPCIEQRVDPGDSCGKVNKEIRLVPRGLTARPDARLQILRIIVFVVGSRFVEHVVDATVLQCFLDSGQQTPHEELKRADEHLGKLYTL